MRPIYVVNNFGQFNHLILRMLRDLGIEARMVPNTTPPDEVAAECRGVVLGGGPSIERVGRAPEYLDLDLPVLGICLGAQLIASAHGRKVYPFVNETGWRSLNRADGATGIFSRFPEMFHVFQLHGETFEIPCGGQLLAYGSDVRNQAFSYRNALGLQFHLEMTGEIIKEWSHDLRKHEQSVIARETPRYLAESNRLCRMVAEDFIGAGSNR